MSIVLNITGTIDLSIFDLNGNLLNDKQEKEVYTKLAEGTYLISLSSKTISALMDFSTVLYNFDFDVLDNTDYEFEID
jgi:hypothetical protein